MAGPPRPRRDRPAIRAHDRWILLVVIVSITFVTFLPTLGNDFVTWDDDDNLTENPLYRGLSWSELRWMWTTTLMGHYIPLTWMTFGLDYLVWGMNPAGYHLTNVVLHAANAALFYVLVQRLLTIALHATLADAFALRLASAFAALLFAVHPLRVESVAWATERRDVLCGFFVLASLLAYLRHATAPECRVAAPMVLDLARSVRRRRPLQGNGHHLAGGARDSGLVSARASRRGIANRA